MLWRDPISCWSVLHDSAVYVQKSTMVHWTAEERAAITSAWAKIDLEQDGLDAMSRLLFVYPWTQRYFSSFGNLSNITAITGNPRVREHGKKVLTAIGNAVKHLDDIKHYLADLSKSHAQVLNVDPENFKRNPTLVRVETGVDFTAWCTCLSPAQNPVI
ncbi:hemoglobin subunit beta-2-like isoform X2 [Mixophyes fleayi]|uniref:hemoglobin subunit beta-2-like isoform X2 n=1 Tax=Mixophyes fleayi TaxID=3061075 RepID=UPI003F4E4294